MRQFRIVDVYTDFLLDENLEDGQSLSNQDVNFGGYGNDNANILNMPIILDQTNQQNVIGLGRQNDNQLPEQTIIVVPLQQLSTQNLDQESAVQDTGIEFADENVVAVSPRVKSEIIDDPVIESESITDNENLNTVADALAMEAIAYEADSPERVSSNICRPELIDLTSDHVVATSGLNDNQNGNAIEPTNAQKSMEINQNIKLPLPNIAEKSNDLQQSKAIALESANEAAHDDFQLIVRNDDAAAIPNDEQLIRPVVATDENFRGAEDGKQHQNLAMATDDIPGSLYPEIIDLISDDEEAVSQDISNVPKNVVENVASQSQSATVEQRVRENDEAKASGTSKENQKSTKTMETKKRFECDLCEYSAVQKVHLVYHMRTHTGERPYECEVCEKRFTQKQDLNRHMKTHREMFAFQCSNCRHGFSHQNKLKLHENRCKAKGYECHLCKKVFIRKHLLVDHMPKHTGEKLHCSKCRKQFAYENNLTQHMKLHGKLFRFQCSNCRQGFSDKKLWKMHENRCKSKQFECYLCSKKFYQQKSNLLEHMRRKHTGEKPFGCSDCPKRFYQKSELTKHTKSCR